MEVLRESAFWMKVRSSEFGCWDWVGPTRKGGYGTHWTGKKMESAHRISYAMHHGEIPKGKLVQHKCDNPACVRPDHLELGTHKSNAIDRAAKGRGGTETRKRTHLSDLDRLQVAAAARNGVRRADIAEAFRVCRTTIYKVMRAHDALCYS